MLNLSARSRLGSANLSAWVRLYRIDGASSLHTRAMCGGAALSQLKSLRGQERLVRCHGHPQRSDRTVEMSVLPRGLLPQLLL